MRVLKGARMTGFSPAILATSVLASAACAFTVGLLMSPSSSPREIDSRPIVDPFAWEKAAPQPAQVQTISVAAAPRSDAVDCGPRDLSADAMEATLQEMQQRGWRPPAYVQTAISDAEADAELDTAYSPEGFAPASFVENKHATGDPSPEAEHAKSGSSIIAVVSDAESRRMWRIAPEAPGAGTTNGSTPMPAQPVSSLTSS